MPAGSGAGGAAGAASVGTVAQDGYHGMGGAKGADGNPGYFRQKYGDANGHKLPLRGWDTVTVPGAVALARRQAR